MLFGVDGVEAMVTILCRKKTGQLAFANSRRSVCIEWYSSIETDMKFTFGLVIASMQHVNWPISNAHHLMYFFFH